MPTPMPEWAESIRRKYVAGEASVFLLHLNAFDQIVYGADLLWPIEFLSEVLLKDNKQNIVVFDPSAGLKVKKGEGLGTRLEDFEGRRSSRELLGVLEAVLLSRDSTAVIIPYADAIIPAGDPALMAEQDRLNVITVHRWSLNPALSNKDNVVFLLTETLAEISPKIVGNPRVAAIEIPLPSEADRLAVIGRADPSLSETQRKALARHTAGLKTVQITALLTPRATPELGEDERINFVKGLLSGSDIEPRAKKLASLTRGLRKREIQELIAPDTPAPARTQDDDELLRLVSLRKREIIEKECAGLIEFIDPEHDLSAVGGNESIKAELRRIAENVRSGVRARIPMGVLFVGPMGSGKTFVANAFVRESRLGAVRLKNIRSKWVGATESNLERVLAMVRSLGPIVLIIDEGDRAFGGDSDSDGGTNSRVIGRIKEFMSDPSNRGQVLFVLMTNRPDKLDVDIKRAGRLDQKIPFFYAQDPVEIETIMRAILRRYGIESTVDWPTRGSEIAGVVRGYSNADLEGVVLLANQMAHDAGGPVTDEILIAASQDYLPARDADMLEYMELLAVFETSRRSLLPERFKTLTNDELNQRLTRLRVKLGL